MKKPISISLKVHDRCMIPDCPALSGGKCWSELPASAKEAVRELRDVVRVYNDFKAADLSNRADAKYVTAEGWHMLLGVLTDRIEQLTGGSKL